MAMRSEEIARDIEGLEQHLVRLRERAEIDKSSFSTLEARLAELKDSSTQTLQAVEHTETLLTEKKSELTHAKEEEALAAYKGALDARRGAGRRAAATAAELLSDLDAYDDQTLGVRRLLEQMNQMPGNAERIAEVTADLAQEPEDLRRAWEGLVAAIKWRLDAKRDEDLLEEAARSVMGRAIDDLPEHLQGLAHERRRARIKEYFGKAAGGSSAGS
jgi:uncharacterized protein YukE